MLNKEICQRCWSRAISPEKNGVLFPVFELSVRNGLSCPSTIAHADEKKFGERYCAAEDDDGPPGWCPYCAEHVVSQDVE